MSVSSYDLSFQPDEEMRDINNTLLHQRQILRQRGWCQEWNYIFDNPSLLNLMKKEAGSDPILKRVFESECSKRENEQIELAPDPKLPAEPTHTEALSFQPDDEESTLLHQRQILRQRGWCQEWNYIFDNPSLLNLMKKEAGSDPILKRVFESECSKRENEQEEFTKAMESVTFK